MWNLCPGSAFSLLLQKSNPGKRDEPRVIKLHFSTLLGNVWVEDILLFWGNFLKTPRISPELGENIPNSRPTRHGFCTSWCPLHPVFFSPGAFLQSLSAFPAPQNVPFGRIPLDSEEKRMNASGREFTRGWLLRPFLVITNQKCRCTCHFSSKQIGSPKSQINK